MERSDWSRLAHTGMEIMNPLPAAKLDEAIEALGSLEGSTARRQSMGPGYLAALAATREELSDDAA